MEMRQRGFGGLSGFALKWIAMASMVADHFGSMVMDGVLAPYLKDGGLTITGGEPFLVRYAPLIKELCGIVGSLAFPIFAFLAVEGFLHTRSQGRYGLRMGLFALISEIPFNLAHGRGLWYPALQNVLFTLCIGVFTLYAIQLARRRYEGKRILSAALTVLAALAGAGLAYWIRSEYVFLGVGTMALLYLLREKPGWRLAAFAPLGAVSPWALLSIPLAAIYNGRRGRGIKYFFYVFYPAHLLLFAGLAELLARR